MQPPIIVDEHGDIGFYPSVEAAAVALEPIDVLSDEYVAYDSAGYLLRMVPSGPRVMITGRVSEQPFPEHLEKAIRSFIMRATGQPAPASASLPQLLSFCIEWFGYEE